MKVAVAQLRIESGALSENLDSAKQAIERAAMRNADLVVLPEVFTVGYFAFDQYEASAQPLDGEVVSTLSACASDHDVAVLCGSFIEDLQASTARGFETPATDGLANTSVFVDDSGTRRGVYRKQHLFGYGSSEQELLTPGETLSVLEYGGFTIGTTTCYDLRFPELYRRLVEAGVTLFLVPSAWPYPRVEHWNTLTRARAIENLAYLVASNGVGEFGDAQLLGRSAVYDPWGTPVAGSGDEPALLEARLDPEAVTRRREEFPALDDKRYAQKCDFRNS